MHRSFSRYVVGLVLAAPLAACAPIAPTVSTLTDANRAQLRASFDASAQTISTALSSAQRSVADAGVAHNFLSSGMALADSQCRQYFRQLGLSGQKYAFARKEMGLASGAVAGIQGLTGVSTKAIAITASLFSFGTASAENYADAFLFSPEISGVQELVETAQQAYRSKIPDVSTINYGMAISLLEGYDQLCEVHTIRRLVNESVSSATPVASSNTDTAKAEAFISTAERSVIARELGEPTVSSAQTVFLYWLLMRSPDEADRATIAKGLQGISLLVAADGKLKPLSIADQARLKRALASVVDRNEALLDSHIAGLKTQPEKSFEPSDGVLESGDIGTALGGTFGGGISVKIKR